MDVLLSCRDVCSSMKFIGRRYIIFSSNRYLYVLDAFKEKAKICIELKESLVSFDLLYTKTNSYICYSTKNASLYIISANFLDQSLNSEEDFQIIRPDFQKQIWKPSLPLELIAVDSNSETCWFLESVTDCDKQITSYRITCGDGTFTLDLLWICDYNQTEFICHGEGLRNTKSFYIASTSTYERMPFLERDDKYIAVSDSLFVNLFGAQNNLECQLILMICFSNGLIHWFPHSTPTNLSLNVFWSLQEEIVNIHSIQIRLLNKKVVENKNCLVVVGQAGSVTIFGLECHPAHHLFQTFCQIYSSDVSDDNLLFSTSHGIYALNLSDILSNGEAKDKITPNLVSDFNVSSFKVNHGICTEDSVKILACLPDGRIVQFSINLSQRKSEWGKKSPRTIKQALTSIEALENQGIELKKSSSILSQDLSYLCIAKHIFRSFKEPNWKKMLEHIGFTDHSDISFIIEPECQCLCTKEQLYKVTINFYFDDLAFKDSKCYSFLAQIVPSQFTDTFPRSLFKSVEMSGNVLCEAKSSRCLLSFICTLSSSVLPLSILTFLFLEFDPINGLSPLLIPLKNFETGILKFASFMYKQNRHRSKSTTKMGINDLIEAKLNRSSVCKARDVPTQSPLQRWESVKIFLRHNPSSPTDIWRNLFKGNNEVYHILQNCTTIELYHMQSIPFRLEVSSSSTEKPVLILSSTSVCVLTSVHREVLFILYEADYLAVPEKLMFPLSEVSEELTSKQILPMEGNTSEDPDPSFDKLHSLFHCYKTIRNL